MSETCLVTGARGFVGTRLLAHLRSRGQKVHALVRQKPFASEPAGGHCKWVEGDVTDADSLQRATRGCALVFHCAWGGSTLDEAWRTNVAGTRNVVMASARAGVRRVVHVSSVAVHGHVLPPELTEDHPMTSSRDPYAITKAQGEREAFAAGQQHGVEVVALRPTLVYGPGAQRWVRSYFMRVKRERVALLNGGDGLANLVFIDDLVDALWAAACSPSAAAEAFLISGSHPVTWRRYLGAFARMCGKPDPPSMPLWRARAALHWSRACAMLTERDARVTRTDIELMPQRCSVSIVKAGSRLGFKPRVDFETGMKHCEKWLIEQGCLGRAARSDVQ